MRQIQNMLRMEFLLIRREKLAVYIFLIPIVMSALIMAVLSALENDNIRLTVTSDMPQAMVERMEQVAEIETVDDLQALHNRVNEFDSMAGVYWDGLVLQVLFQGNEGPEYEAVIREVLDRAMNTSLSVSVESDRIDNRTAERGWLMQLISAVLLTAPTAIGGIVSGFNIVAEKETLMSRAYRISPLPTRRYFASRYLVSVLVGIINLICISLILGVGGKLYWILLASVFALPLFACSPLLIGGIAKDKMGCISIIKVIMLIFLCLPIAAGVTPERWQFFYWPFPMYWHFKTFESILMSQFSLRCAVLTFVISAAVSALLARMLGKRLQSE